MSLFLWSLGHFHSGRSHSAVFALLDPVSDGCAGDPLCHLFSNTFLCHHHPASGSALLLCTGTLAKKSDGGEQTGKFIGIKQRLPYLTSHFALLALLRSHFKAAASPGLGVPLSHLLALWWNGVWSVSDQSLRTSGKVPPAQLKNHWREPQECLPVDSVKQVLRSHQHNCYTSSNPALVWCAHLFGASAGGWPSVWSLLETWWCSSLPCLLLFPGTLWTVAWWASRYPTLSMWVTHGAANEDDGACGHTEESGYCWWAGYTDTQLAGEDELRAGDQYRCRGESERIQRDWKWGAMIVDHFPLTPSE